MTDLNRADQKGGALREIESALIKGCLVASVTVVIHSVYFLTKFSFGLLAKQKQKVVSSPFILILFYSNT